MQTLLFAHTIFVVDRTDGVDVRFFLYIFFFPFHLLLHNFVFIMIVIQTHV